MAKLTPSQQKYIDTLESRGLEILSIAPYHDKSGKIVVIFQNPNLLCMSHHVVGKRGGVTSKTIDH
jgi:hypothetical protein